MLYRKTFLQICRNFAENLMEKSEVEGFKGNSKSSQNNE